MAPEEDKTTTAVAADEVEDVQPQAGDKRKADDAAEEEVAGDDVKKQKVDLAEENEGECERMMVDEQIDGREEKRHRAEQGLLEDCKQPRTKRESVPRAASADSQDSSEA